MSTCLWHPTLDLPHLSVGAGSLGVDLAFPLLQDSLIDIPPAWLRVVLGLGESVGERVSFFVHQFPVPNPEPRLWARLHLSCLWH